MTNSQFLDALVNSAMNWVQTGHGHDEMADNFNAYCKACRVDTAASDDHEAIHHGRLAVANEVATKTIHQLSTAQSHRLYSELKSLADSSPMAKRMARRRRQAE